MDLRDLDLNLLVAFDAILDTRSVTAAAARLDISQSSMSYGLAKLRKVFDDPLFVRTATGLQPTPRAMQLADPVRRALEIVQGQILKQADFDPLKSTRTFTLSMSDVAGLHFLPGILKFLAQEAPGVNLKTVAVSRNHLEDAMAAGELDLVIGFFPDLRKAGFYQQSLFHHGYVCVARTDHPRIGSELTLKQYVAESHVVVRHGGRTYEVIERFLEKKGIVRRVVLETPHSTSVPFIIASSDLIAVLPVGMAQAFTEFPGLKIVSLPFALPTANIKQHWHERFQHDQENMWLRQRIAQTFTVQ
ncbi:MAG TPA: LysR family transcriptional regulator [Ramlibacter sp.]|nr:LysR family transcriptional regulator [Ramlibacter sp.]